MEKKRRGFDGLIPKIDGHRMPLVGPNELPIGAEGITLLIGIGYDVSKFFEADWFVVSRKWLH